MLDLLALSSIYFLQGIAADAHSSILSGRVKRSKAVRNGGNLRPKRDQSRIAEDGAHSWSWFAVDRRTFVVNFPNAPAENLVSEAFVGAMSLYKTSSAHL